ncbi:MAG: hypothetical protein K1X55_00035 [Chitinophagales bacterium]|nr:hypothetical protein [Chitinophagales bacterium]
MRHLSIIFIVLTLFVLSCQKDSSEDFILRYGYEYFPDEEGNYVIYNVDSITYNDFFNPVLVTRKSFQLKEVIGESFTDLSGRPSKKLYRYTRENASSTWNIADVYYQTLNKNTAEKVEENLRYIKLVFPIKSGKEWSGNIFINPADNLSYLEDWTYQMQAVDEPFSNAALSFDSTLTVLQQYDSSAINLTSSKEVYAKGAGLVYKELKVLTSQNNFDQPWEQRAEQGFILRMSAIEYGKE